MSADISHGTINKLFFEQVKEVTLATAKSKTTYKNQLGKILEMYAPDTSLAYMQRY